jgi:hypothetical protein
MMTIVEMDIVPTKLIDSKPMDRLIHLLMLEAREIQEEILESSKDLNHITIISIIQLTVQTARY